MSNKINTNKIDLALIVKLTPLFCKTILYTANDGHDEAKPHLSEESLEDSVDKALNKADYNWDGFISWDEYVYSMGDKEVEHHIKEHETHEV